MGVRNTSRVAAAAIVAVAAVAASPRPAAADPIKLTVKAGPSLQQTENRPCVIGDPSCHNPSSFAFTLIPPHDDADMISSPSYTVAQIRNMVGDVFYVGVDLNQAPGHDDGAFNLQSFTLSVNGSVVYSLILLVYSSSTTIRGSRTNGFVESPSGASGFFCCAATGDWTSAAAAASARALRSIMRRLWWMINMGASGCAAGRLRADR